MEYVTVEREAADEFIEKKSRFIGSCRPVQTEEEALDFIAKLKSQYWDASHNVYAYILREGNIARFSDDGEPQGTAGIPVIDTLKRPAWWTPWWWPPGTLGASCWGAAA